MSQIRTVLIHAGAAGLLFLATQTQAEPAAEQAAAAVEDATPQTTTPADGSGNSVDPEQQRDAEAREKAKEIIQEMRNKLGTE